MIDGSKDGAWDRWHDELNRPLPGSNPDAVRPDTMDEEMALFRSGRQNMQ